MTRLQDLLARIHRLLASAEHCAECVGPSVAFEGEHLAEWQRLKEELRREITRLPN